MRAMWEENSNNNLERSLEFLKQNPELNGDFENLTYAFRDMLELIPFEISDLSSGRNFPFFESDYEINAAYALALRGYYRIAFSTLRNVLELTLISIYYDLNDNASSDIENWVKSKENTPFFSPLIKKIFSHPHFENFQDIKSDVQNIYWELSNYNHTKGVKYSNRKLGSQQIIGHISYNENSLKKFFVITEEVIGLSLIMASIKYPISFLEVPLFQKYGFNRPMGYFLDSDQSNRWKTIFGEPITSRLVDFARQNKKALEMQKHVLDLPDITDSQIEDQYFNMHKDTIKVKGFLAWEKDFGKTFITISQDDGPEAISKKEARKLRYESWAKEHQCYDRGLTHEELLRLQRDEIAQKSK